MKRAAESDARSPSEDLKRPRSTEHTDTGVPDASVFEPSLQRRVADVLEGRSDGTGFVHVHVSMKWPPVNQSMRLRAEALDGSSDTKFGVVFTGDCAPYLRHINSAIGIKDDIYLALKDGVLDTTSPMLDLSFEHGAVIKVVKRANPRDADPIVNTWNLKEQDDLALKSPKVSDWFATPAATLRRDISGTQMGTGRRDYAPAYPAMGVTVTPVGPVALAAAVLRAEPERESPLSNPTQSTVAFPAASKSSTSIDRLRTGTPPAQNGHKSASPPPGVSSTSSLNSDTSTKPQSKRGNSSGPRKQAVFKIPQTSSYQEHANKPLLMSKENARLTRASLEAKLPIDKPISKKDLKKERRRLKQLQRMHDVRAPEDQIPPFNLADAAIAATDKNFGVNTSLDPSTLTSPHVHTEPVHTSSNVAMAEFTPYAEGDLANSSSAQSSAISNIPTSTLISSLTPPAQRGDPEPSRSKLASNSPSLISQQSADSILAPLARSGSSVPPISHGLDPTLHTSVHYASSSGRLPKSDSDSPDLSKALADGFYTEHGRYSPLVKLTEKISYNIMGVVVSSGERSRTATGDNKLRLYLTDPSIGECGAFSVICFARASELLPEAMPGNILMLRQIYGDSWQGSACGVAPSYKGWSWAKFDPRDNDSTPVSSPIGVHNLRFQPTENELRYCRHLVDWWKSIYPEAYAHAITVHKVTSRYSLGGSGRVHRLIADASPTAEPQGYFDCTVEVLAGYPNENGVYTLFVTDYTRNNSIVPVEKDMWPKQLCDKVLKFELFAPAAEKGPAIAERKGYYFFGNCRMKVSTGGYWEATWSQINKMRRLDEDELEAEPHLAELLKRKEKFNAMVAAHTDEFPHKRFDEVEEERIFCCTVEVLHVSPKDERTYLYVTDYTSRTDLAVVDMSAPIFQGLQDRVVKIALFNGQATTGNNLAPGDLVLIRNLRLKSFGGTKKLSGRLGGDARLINKLQAKTANNLELTALLRRKEEWQTYRNKRGKHKSPQSSAGQRKGNSEVADAQSIPCKTLSASPNSGEIILPNPAASAQLDERSRVPLTRFTSIKEVEASEKCMDLHQVKARIVDIYPEELKKFTVRRCTNCSEDISDTFRVCPACDDVMDPEGHSFVRTLWAFWFVIEDEEGSQLKLSVYDENCNLLEGIDPLDINEGYPDALKELTNRLTPLVGHLMQERNGTMERILDRASGTENRTPTLHLTCTSFMPDENVVAKDYILLHHEILS